MPAAALMEGATLESDADPRRVAARCSVGQKAPPPFERTLAEELDFDPIRKPDQVRSKRRSLLAPQFPQCFATVQLLAGAGRGGRTDDTSPSESLSHALLISMTRTAVPGPCGSGDGRPVPTWRPASLSRWGNADGRPHCRA